MRERARCERGLRAQGRAGGAGAGAVDHEGRTETSFNAVGQVLHYTIVAKNVGNTTLAAVTVTDPGVTGLSCTPANGSSLAPGASMTCTATHTVTQADLDAGHYANTACVDDGAGGAAQQCASATVPAVQAPELAITKVADRVELQRGRADVFTTRSWRRIRATRPWRR